MGLRWDKLRGIKHGVDPPEIPELEMERGEFYPEEVCPRHCIVCLCVVLNRDEGERSVDACFVRQWYVISVVEMRR